ncbi:hypothetical protein EI77_00368 [Prosthecobacter fusiformis]|uniref:Uncharacterized protein n=2 Tax=Prosthecobacter fusiformis TaxID=48464 RepID=A0A4R7SRI7_9BACT|nr:hypothetical protein EI77_00368 [Prosthecobacter fusiformis]
MEAFARHYFLNISPDAESLIHMTDWGLYEPSQMIAITGIRGSRGEDRWLIDAPGHRLTSEEVELGISLFSLSASFAWSSYVYSPSHCSTLYNWEGDIFDFWTDSVEVFAEMKLLLTQHNLTEITRG